MLAWFPENVAAKVEQLAVGSLSTEWHTSSQGVAAAPTYQYGITGDTTLGVGGARLPRAGDRPDRRGARQRSQK